MGGRSVPWEDEALSEQFGQKVVVDPSIPVTGNTTIYSGLNEVRATSSTGGEKGRKPEEYALIPVEPLAEVARVYGYGSRKYSAQNWRSGYPYSWSLSALMRHIEAFRRGESYDSESGLHHLAHAEFHLNTLMHFDITGTGEDDRADAA